MPANLVNLEILNQKEMWMPFRYKFRQSGDLIDTRHRGMKYDMEQMYECVVIQSTANRWPPNKIPHVLWFYPPYTPCLVSLQLVCHTTLWQSIDSARSTIMVDVIALSLSSSNCCLYVLLKYYFFDFLCLINLYFLRPTLLI